MLLARQPNGRWTTIVAALALNSAACERCAPGLVGEGVAKLTIRNSGAILELINADDRCGFESAAARASVVVEGAPGTEGTATWTVEECDIELVEPVVKADCRGVETSMQGLLRVSARRVVAGVVSGDPANPVVPIGPDAVTIHVDEAKFIDFRVESSTDENVLTMLTGQVRFEAKPRLARSRSSGVCMVPTPNILIRDIEYLGARLRVQTGSRDFMVPVPSSKLWAVNGSHGGTTNDIGGKLTVWNVDVDVDPSDGLDPEYEPLAFEAGYACADDLVNPVSFDCAGLGEKLSQGAGRLTVQSFGTMVDLLDKDERCGFRSPAVLAATHLEGEVGGLGAAEQKVESCTLEVPPGTVARTDCTGATTEVSGRVTVSATKRIEGRLTGDPLEPAVPMKDGPARIDVHLAVLDGFRVASGPNALTQVSGTLSGSLFPRVAKDASRGACSVETGIARFENLRYTDAALIVESPSGRFETTVPESDLRAVNGRWGGDENLLRGHITVGADRFDLPSDPADDGLDPEYDPAAFDAKWQCGDVTLPPSFDCHFVAPIAQGAAQLGVKTIGTLAKLLESDTVCGFASPGVKATTITSGELGREGGSARFVVDTPCRIVLPPGTVVEEDCHGVKTYAEGTVRLTGTKTIHGWLSGHPDDPAVPDRPDAVEVRVAADFSDFRLSIDPGGHGIEVASGGLSGTVRPRLAIDTARGACALPTPVAQLEDVAWRDAALRITSEGKTFEVHAGSSSLLAVNGAIDGMENHLVGHVEIDGERVSIPTDPTRPVLDPEYDAARFAASYACTPNLRVPQHVSECSLRKTIGEGAARLLVQTLGVVTKMVNEDDDCGFESNLTDPDRVVGDPGQLGEMEWSVNNCQMRRRPDREDRPIDEDCLDIGTYVAGGVTVSGRRLVRGIRENINILFLRFYSIKPNDREAVSVDLDAVDFDEFRAFERSPDEVTPRRALTVHSGRMSAAVTPILGENRRSRGTYDVPTPLARLRTIRVDDAPVTVLNEGMTFRVHVDEARLDAFNGAYRGERNWIEGYLVVDGQRIELPRQDLDPDYDQQRFDRRYSCTSNLTSLVPPQ